MKYSAALCLLAATTLAAGCQSDRSPTGDSPGVIQPQKSSGDRPVDSRPTTRNASRVIADVEGVTVDEQQLIDLLYQSNGLDALLKLVQLNMSKAAARAKGLSVSPADVVAERKLTMSLAFPGQDEADYDGLLRQLLQQQRVSRAEFDVVMETNANLRAVARGQSSTDITEPAIENEYNLLYGERVRIRDIPVSNLQEVGEVQRMLAQPNARFEDVARRMGKVPALAALGGQLPEFARTSSGYSQVFIQAAFSLQPGQTSTDPIEDQGFFHVIKVEDRIAPKAVKLDDVRDSVREQLIVRRSNNLMGEMRKQFAQRAVRELKIYNAGMQKEFSDRVAASNPKQADKSAVQRSLEEQGAKTTTAPAIADAPTAVATQPSTRAAAAVTRPSTAPAVR